MQPDLTLISAGELARHADFVRTLARRLLADDASAEDVAQETTLAALSRPPQAPERLRSWMLTVGKRLALREVRGRARRRQREECVAREESVASQAAALEAGESLRLVSEAVLSLAEPYRSVILMRFYQGMTPTQIAEGSETPLSTVESRLRRALQRLRARLDREVPGGRAEWCAGLMVFVVKKPRARTTALAAPGATIGALIVSTQGKIIAGLVALGVGSALFWKDTRSAPLTPADARVEAAAEMPALVGLEGQVAERRSEAAAQDSPAAGAVAIAPPTQVPVTSGTLTLVVRWQESGLPAVDRGFDLLPWGSGQPFEGRRMLRTDERGRARAEGLPAGRILVYGDVGGGGSVELAAGSEQELELELPPGMLVSGHVRAEDGAPIAAASIWLSAYGNSGEGQVVATTDAEGRYQVPAVGSDRYLAARAPGFLPQPMRLLQGAVGSELVRDFVLTSGGAGLRGLVLDPGGRPLAGARVRLEAGDDSERDLGDGERGAGLASTTTRTSPEGAFELTGLPAGEVLLLVRAPECAPVSVALTLVPGLTTQRDVALSRPGMLNGRVVDPDGQAIVEAKVECGDYGQFLFCMTKTDSDGRYRLDSLPVGDVSIRLRHERFGDLTEVLALSPGVAREWNPVLDAGLVLQGRVTDALGEACAQLYVEALCLQAIPGSKYLWSEQQQSDEQGRFRFVGCPDAPLRLTFKETYRSPAVLKRLTDCRADGVPLEVVVDDLKRPTAYVEGQVLDPLGEPAATLVRIVGREQYVDEARSQAQTGRFAFGPLPPGRYTLYLTPEGEPTRALPSFELARGQHLVLDPIRSSPLATLRITVDGVEGALAPYLELRILPSDSQTGAVRASPLRFVDELPQPLRLLPGEYTLGFRSESVAYRRELVRVSAEQPTELRVESEPGVRVRLKIAPPSGRVPGPFLQVTLRSSDPELVVSDSVRLGDDGLYELRQCLPAGAWRVQAEMIAATGSCAFDLLLPPGGSEVFVERTLVDESGG